MTRALLVLFSLLLPLPAFATSGGIFSRSGKQGTTCVSCHQQTAAGASVIGLAPSYAPGDTVTFAVWVSPTISSDQDNWYAGFNAAVSDGAGTFLAGTGTRVDEGALGSEIAHDAPAVGLIGAPVSWTVELVLDDDALGEQTLWVAAVESHGTGEISDPTSTTTATFDVTPAPDAGVADAGVADALADARADRAAASRASRCSPCSSPSAREGAGADAPARRAAHL